MALTNTQYNSIMREYEERQTKNRHLLEERTARVYRQVDGYRALCDCVASLSVSEGKKLLEGDTNALENLKSSIASLSLRKEQLLSSRTFRPRCLQPEYLIPKF